MLPQEITWMFLAQWLGLTVAFMWVIVTLAFFMWVIYVWSGGNWFLRLELRFLQLVDKMDKPFYAFLDRLFRIGKEG